MPKKKNIIRFEDVRDRIVEVRGQKCILDFAVAELYGVETREINQAVKNNPRKFPNGWVLELDNQESTILRSKFLMLESSQGKGRYSKHNYKAFTERGIYMLATIMAKGGDEAEQKSLMQKSGEIAEDLFGDAFSTSETETEIELNFAVLKLKHKIKRKKE